MPLYLIRREVPKASKEDIEAALLRAVSCAFNYEGMKWVTSYWDGESGRAYCIYEAQSADEVRDHAERARIPCDEVLPVVSFAPENLMTAPGALSGLSAET